MPQARLVLHTKYVDELGGIVKMKAYQVPKTMSRRTATNTLWSTSAMGSGWSVTVIMSKKATTITIAI